MVELREWVIIALGLVQVGLLLAIALRVYRYGRGNSAVRRLTGQRDQP